jgi:hypothetical protein
LDVILHAGQHKTGTTAVQAFLRDRRDDLAARGILVPRTGMALAGTHRPLVAATLGEGAGAPMLAGLAREFARSSCARAVISAEYAKTVAAQGRGGVMLDALRRAGAERVTIVLYLRAPFALANAAFAQGTAALQIGGATFPEHIMHLLARDYFNYANILRLAERADAALVVRPYGAAVRQGVIADLMRTLGTDDLAPATEERLNPSRGPLALEAARRLAVEFGTLPPEKRIAAMNAIAALAPPEAPLWAVDEEAERRLAAADAATELVAQAAWGRPWREAIGDERRPLNTFATAMAADPEGAPAAFRRLIAQMRAAARAAMAAAVRQARAGR